MFNLEDAIAAWRSDMQSAGVKNSDVLDELENHLREEVSRLRGDGASEALAFERAVASLGQIGLLKEEFAKVPGTKWAWFRKLKLLMSGAFFPDLSESAYSADALRTLQLAREEAPRLQHCFVGTEHVLLGLLAIESGVISNVLRRLRIDCDQLKREIEELVGIFPSNEMPGPPPFTPRVKKSLRLAADEAKSSGKQNIGPEHIFLGLFLEESGVAGFILRRFGLTANAIRAEIAHAGG